MAKGKPTKKSTKKKQQEAKQKRDQLIMAVGAVILAIIAFLVFGGNPAANSTATINGLPAEINTAMAYEMFEEGAYMLDVRNPDEWVEYHVDGATLIPLPELEGRVNEVPRDQEIIVICNSGNRSQVARDILLEAGFTNVTSIAGGIQGWMSAGHDFVRGE
jgi:rhodanese-related sulfurtransferase